LGDFSNKSTANNVHHNGAYLTELHLYGAQLVLNSIIVDCLTIMPL